MEAEYTAASVMGQELLGVRELVTEMGILCEDPMYLRGDNQAALKQLDGEKVSSKAKHIDVRIKFMVDYTKRGVLKTEYSEGERMPADMFTKVLAAPRLKELAELVGLHWGSSYNVKLELSKSLAENRDFAAVSLVWMERSARYTPSTTAAGLPTLRCGSTSL
ncbi:hypothetical protein ON010_g9130 [Phytophthora cinnamomi]|nr:hypothetical protein ON010_g9130 [Phytophthora cinnamomi]